MPGGVNPPPDPPFEHAPSFWVPDIFTYFLKAQIGEGDYPIQADFVENTNKAVTAARVAVHEEAAIGKHRQGTASTDENKHYDPGWTSEDPLISA